MVELSEGIRKVRRVFLFHDVIVSSKQKPTRAGMKFEPKWFLPLSELTFHSPEGSPEGECSAAQWCPCVSHQVWMMVISTPVHTPV